MDNFCIEDLFNPDPTEMSGYFIYRRSNVAEKDTWKVRLSDLLKEHEDIGKNFTGQVVIHMNQGGVSKVFANKELK